LVEPGLSAYHPGPAVQSPQHIVDPLPQGALGPHPQGIRALQLHPDRSDRAPGLAVPAAGGHLGVDHHGALRVLQKQQPLLAALLCAEEDAAPVLGVPIQILVPAHALPPCIPSGGLCPPGHRLAQSRAVWAISTRSSICSRKPLSAYSLRWLGTSRPA